MMNQTSGLHHYHLRKRIHQKHEPFPHPNALKRFYDKILHTVLIFAPLTNIPQLLKVWVEKDASVSVITWIFFAVISATWVGYGVLNNDKYIMATSAALMVMQVLIVVGTVLHG